MLIFGVVIMGCVSKEEHQVTTPQLQTEQKQVYNKDPVELLLIGSVQYGKGIDILIDALSKPGNDNWKLNVAGSFNSKDPYFRSIRKTIDKYGLSPKIRFLGECDAEKIEELYLSSDLLVHPSRFESYGMAVGEALCHGLPVLSSDAGALPSVYHSTPVHFFKTEDSTSLLTALSFIFDADNYSRMCNEIENYFCDQESAQIFNNKLDKLITMMT